MKKLIVVADWASDLLTCQEFKSVVEGYVKNPENINISFVSVTPSTIHTGYVLNQIIHTEERLGRPQETIIIQNTDPRLQNTENVVDSKGAEFIITKLFNGIYVCGPNAGFDFSFIKNSIENIYLYPNLNKGSQFRSRDLYSRVCSHLMDELEDELELEETHSNIIPVIQEHFIGHIDNFGNIKTTILNSEFKGKKKFGDIITIKINNIIKKAKYVPGLFGGKVGELVIYPGSSGNIHELYLEISIWQHFDTKNVKTGLETFNYPKAGMTIEIF
ncbi:MAG: SAM-dependent chlorinase/fluorinase [bacterium]|nr:SAM-dependent chlorinase/fluorinase [bacterium]